MIESLTGMTYGRVITEVVYKDGSPATSKQTSITSIPIPSRKELLDTIFVQLQRLQECDSIQLEIFANPMTREANRIEVTSKCRLD